MADDRPLMVVAVDEDMSLRGNAGVSATSHDAFRYDAAPSTVMEEQLQPPRLAGGVSAEREPHPPLIPKMLDRRSLVPHQPAEMPEWINLVMVDDGGFVVAIGDHDDQVIPRPEPFCAFVEHQVKIVSTEMLRPDAGLAASTVLLALHQTQKVAEDQNFGVALSCFIKVPGQQLAIT